MLNYHEFYLTLIRHGQSTQNQNPDLMGQMPDVPLSERGIKQAVRLGERLKLNPWDKVYSSPYTRAINTAMLATGLGPEITLVPDLREYSAGQWTNQSRSQIVTLPVAAELAKENKIANYYCFSHGMTIKCLLHYVLGYDKSMTWKVTIENTSISQLYFGKDGWRLLSINDHAHLATSWSPNEI